MNPIVRAVEPAACPSLTKGTYTYDYGDSAGACVLLSASDWLPVGVAQSGHNLEGDRLSV